MLAAQRQVAPTKRECERTLPMRGGRAERGSDYWDLRMLRQGMTSTKSTASVELASAAKGATAARPDA